MTTARAPTPRRDRPAGPPGPRLLLRIYAIGVATALGIAGSWFAAHQYIRVEWPVGNAMMREMLRDLPARWADGTLSNELDRIGRSVGMPISVYDTRGTLVASSAQPPFAPPTPDQQRQAAAGEIKTHFGFGPVVIGVRRGQTLLGFCVLNRESPQPPLWGVVMDLIIMSTWISAVGYLVWRTLVRPLQRIARAAEAFGAGNMAARTGVHRDDDIGKVARAFDDMSDRIARSREAERELMASLSHELRTPMARIRVALDLAAESDAETVRASLADVAEDLTELETLMGNIFSTTRLEMAATRGDEPVPLQRAEIDFSGLVEKAIAHQRAQHPDRPYQLEVAPGTAGRSIYVDAVLVRRAIENVLENAHKYSPAGAAVTVAVAYGPNDATKTLANVHTGAHDDGEAFRITITDRGFGIRPDDLPRVFSPFFRADRSRTRATGGVGLGLALAKRVIEAHGGRIGITSQVDAGTTVTFVLPVAEPPRRTANAIRNIS